jgi:hypothetical protein
MNPAQPLPDSILGWCPKKQPINTAAPKTDGKINKKQEEQ